MSNTTRPELSGKDLNIPQNEWKPSRLYRLKVFFIEVYLAFTYHYFVERTENKPLTPYKQSEWLRLDKDTKRVGWVINPRAALPFGYVFGVLIIIVLRRKDKEKKYSYALITVQDVAFIHYVTEGEGTIDSSYP